MKASLEIMATAENFQESLDLFSETIDSMVKLVPPMFSAFEFFDRSALVVSKKQTYKDRLNKLIEKEQGFKDLTDIKDIRTVIKVYSDIIRLSGDPALNRLLTEYNRATAIIENHESSLADFAVALNFLYGNEPIKHYLKCVAARDTFRSLSLNHIKPLKVGGFTVLKYNSYCDSDYVRGKDFQYYMGSSHLFEKLNLIYRCLSLSNIDSEVLAAFEDWLNNYGRGYLQFDSAERFGITQGVRIVMYKSSYRIELSPQIEKTLKLFFSQHGSLIQKDAQRAA